MPLPVRGFSFTPSPVPNCPACKPNSGSRFPSLSTEAHSSREGPTLLCNHVDFHLETGGFRESGTHASPLDPVTVATCASSWSRPWRVGGLVWVLA